MLKIDQLQKSFGNKQILNNLCLEIPEGTIFGLVGINGAGKSTLLRCIAGVYEPEQGSILFNDSDTYEDERVRNEIAFVSDEAYFPVGSTIKSVKLLYETLYDCFSQEDYKKYLELFQLDENASIVNLSKGNKRRVSLLFALCTKPKLLLLDEAYDGLEPLARYKFKNVLTQLIEDEQITVIISSHNLKELEDICDSFGILEDGKMMEYGDLTESKENLNKYQIVFDQELEDNAFDAFDILHLEHEGRVYKLVAKGNQNTVLSKIQEMHPLLVDVLQVNFEELFIYELQAKEKSHDQQ